MSRVTINDSILTAVANAIRNKLGETDSISPLDFAEAILAIEGGGGSGGESPFNVATTTLATESQTLTFEHDLGTVPTFYVIFASDPTGLIGDVAYKFVGIMSGMGGYGCLATSSSKALRWVASSTAFVLSSDSDTITFTNTNNTYKFATGVEYSCIYW